MSRKCGHRDLPRQPARLSATRELLHGREVWRLKRAEYALSLRCLPGSVWELILGHCTFLGLQEQGTMSTFFTIYPFIEGTTTTASPQGTALFCVLKLDVLAELAAASLESHCHCL